MWTLTSETNIYRFRWQAYMLILVLPRDIPNEQDKQYRSTETM
jgi:hypothetical protein